VTREFELLVACAQTVIGACPDGKLQKALTRPIDWPYALELAEAHRVTPLVSTALKSAGDAVPPYVTCRLRRALRAAAARNLILTSEMRRLLCWFDKPRIQAVPFKGPVLTSAAYGNLAIRTFDDLDILVRRQDVTRAGELLCSHGYRAASCLDYPQENLRFHWNGQLTFVREDGLVSVDLHWDLTPRHFPIAFGAAHVFQDLHPAVVAGTEVLTLSPEDLLVYLCAHGSKHLWQRLVWVCDIAGLIRTQVLDWDRVYARAEGSERMLAIGLLLARDLMSTSLPGHIAARIAQEGHAVVLAKQIHRRLPLRFGSAAQTRDVFFFNWRATGRTWLKLRYALGLIALPAEADWAPFNLPAWLFFLHYPLRLGRLLIKYTRFRAGRSQAAVPMS
jgi:putative nucleotidyltransferase-like protein